MIEIMIAVVIVGIVSAMAVPRFQKAYERMKFRTENREIVSTMRLARSKAITEKQNFGVSFDNSSGTITLFRKNPTSTNLTQFESTDSTIQIDTLSNGFNNITTDITNNTLTFQPNGSAVFSGSGNIVTLASTPDIIGIYHINVLASTGRVKGEGYYY